MYLRFDEQLIAHKQNLTISSLAWWKFSMIKYTHWSNRVCKSLYIFEKKSSYHTKIVIEENCMTFEKNQLHKIIILINGEKLFH